MSTCVDLAETMDAKDLRTESTLGDRSNDAIATYSHGNSVQQSNRSKPYQDNGSSPLGKVDVPSARPCAVIGPDRVVPPTAPDAYLKKSLDPWPSPDEYRRPPDYPHKLDYHHPTRNISPRQTFQENMQRIMVPHNTYSATKVREDHNFPVDSNLSPLRSNKLNVSTEPKYCDVPYTVNPLTNEQKNIRNTDISMSNINLGLRNAPHGWSAGSANIRPSKPYAASELYQYPDYQSCGGPRPMMLPQPHRAVQEDPPHVYPEAYYHEANLRFKSYAIKERHPQTRYEYLPNYSNPAHPPPPFPSHRYDLQKPLPPHMQAYPGYSQVPLKYMDSRMAEPVINGYQRPTNPPPNYNSVPYINQMIHPSYGSVPSNCLQPNKYFPYHTDPSVKPIAANKPYDANSKMYSDFDPTVYKTYPMPDNIYGNDINRGHRLKGPIVNHNYPAVNMHGIPHPYYRKDNPVMRNYDYSVHYPAMNVANPSAVAISPSDSNTSNDTQIQGSLHEDYGYVSQSSSASARSIDIGLNRIPNEINRRYDYRYGPIMKSPFLSKSDSKSTKGKKDINVRQFLSMWSEVEDENSENNKEKPITPGNTINTTSHYESKTQEQLYVLGLVNVPSEELGKYEHIQKVSKLPENIKGYNSLELLNQFEEAIESSNLNNYTPKPSISREFHGTIKSSLSGIDMHARALSPLDVESKISQSIIHKDVGCNFEIKPCSPKMLNVEVAAPIHTVIGERVIEKVNNPLITPPVRHNVDDTIDNYKNMKLDQRISINDNKVPSCKMINTQFSNSERPDSLKTNYSLQDLESSSGVCLASLPRLDNDIELNFPEVNQQFINANKSDSVITTVSKDLPALEAEQSDITKANIENDNIMKQLSCTDSENEFSKLSKYRKLKRKSVETSIEEVPIKRTCDINAQTLRTDSVIIKNPENIKAQDNVPYFSSTTYIDDTHNPINLSMNSEERIKELDKITNIQMEINEIDPTNAADQNSSLHEISTKNKVDILPIQQEIVNTESKHKSMEPEINIKQCDRDFEIEVEAQLKKGSNKTELSIETELSSFEINKETSESSKYRNDIVDSDDFNTVTNSVEMPLNEESIAYKKKSYNERTENISIEKFGLESTESLVTQKIETDLQESPVLGEFEYATYDRLQSFSENKNCIPHFYKELFSSVVQNLILYENGLVTGKAINYDSTQLAGPSSPQNKNTEGNILKVNNVYVTPNITSELCAEKLQTDIQTESLTLLPKDDITTTENHKLNNTLSTSQDLSSSISIIKNHNPTPKCRGNTFEDSKMRDKDTENDIACEISDTSTEIGSMNTCSSALLESEQRESGSDSDSSTDSDSDSTSDTSEDEEDSKIESESTSNNVLNAPKETTVSDIDITQKSDYNDEANTEEMNTDEMEIKSKLQGVNVESKFPEKSVGEIADKISMGVTKDLLDTLDMDQIDKNIVPNSLGHVSSKDFSNECAEIIALTKTNPQRLLTETNEESSKFESYIECKSSDLNDEVCKYNENINNVTINAGTLSDYIQPKLNEMEINMGFLNTLENKEDSVDSNAERNVQSTKFEDSFVQHIETKAFEQRQDTVRVGDQNDEINTTVVSYSVNSELWINRSNLKRSLSESALNTYRDDYQFNKSSLWSRKRRRINETNGFSENHLNPENSVNVMSQNRRNSISSIYNEDNVSFCILIENDCIVDCEETEKICIAEFPAECIDTYEDNREDVTPMQEDLFCEYTDEYVEECIEDNPYEESWIEDIACVETVVSEEIEENSDASVSVSPKDLFNSDDESNDEEGDSFSVNDHADKVKYIYGDKMFNDDTNLVETLYRTPQMNVNKTLVSRELQCADRYYDRQALEEILSDKHICTHKINDLDSFKRSDCNHETLNMLGSAETMDENILENIATSKEYNMEHEKTPNQENLMQVNALVTEKYSNDTVELNVDNNLSDVHSDTKSVFSSSPEVSSTTSEEKNSGILMKITSFGGSRISQVNTNCNNKSACCKYTENKGYSHSDPTRPSRPLITKAAQKYIPPLKETINDLKIKLHLPQHSLFKLKQLKISKEKPKLNVTDNNNIKPSINKKEINSKKPKPKFEDVLKSIDKEQFKLRKDNNIKKIKNSIPKVVIKKSINGSHYASTSREDQYNPDLTGRKWQPWVFLEKNHFVDSMALKGKTKAIFNYRKNTYVLSEKFKKYKSVNSQFVISQPAIGDVSTGNLKYTIRLKHRY